MQFFGRNQSQDIEIPEFSETRRQIVMGLILLLAVVSIITNTLTITTQATEASLVPFGVAIGCVIAFFMLRRKILVPLALHLPVAMLALTMMFVVEADSTFYGVLSVALLIISAMLTQLPIYILINILVLGWSIYQQSLGYETAVLLAVVSIGLSLLVYYLVNNFENVTTTARRVNKLLYGSSNIGQSINENLDLQRLLDFAVNTVREEFDFYHVQVFLIDDNYQYANLVASTGEAGRQLLARNHRLPVGSQSVIGRVSQVGEPVIAQNTSSDTVHALNELLPDTRAELALPLIDAGSIIGALDVQSVNADAFQPIDIQALQIIANQLAVAIRNARLFEEAQRNIQENKRLLFEYETNLREVDRLNRSLTQQSWDNYLAHSYVDGVTLSGDRFTPQATWSDMMTEATQNQQPATKSTDTGNTFAIPIILRGQVLGAIEVELDADTNSNDAIEMVEAISQRLAISLESARLFEETQEASLQEQQINEIVSSYETALTIDELLQVTLEKLQQSLGAEKGSIRLGITSPNGSSTHLHNGNGGSAS